MRRPPVWLRRLREVGGLLWEVSLALVYLILVLLVASGVLPYLVHRVIFR